MKHNDNTFEVQDSDSHWDHSYWDAINVQAKKGIYGSLKGKIIYTDGSCRSNNNGSCRGKSGLGGGAFVIQHLDREKHDGREEEEESGQVQQRTTGNRMEMMAAIKALEALKEPSCVALYSDSQYLVEGMIYLIHRWKKHGWLTIDKQQVKNIDLWEQLYSSATTHKIGWYWVRGHAGNPMNIRVDKLAVKARKLAEASVALSSSPPKIPIQHQRHS